MSRWDLIVAGGGVIGLGAAFSAASAGWRVLVLEASEQAPSGASAVAAGMLAPLAEAHDMPDDLVRAAIESAEAYASFIGAVERHGGPAGFVDRGTLLVAADRDQAGDLEQLRRSHARLGVAAEPLSIRELLRREPRISPRVAGALWCPDDHAVSPLALGRALVLAIEALGGEVRTGLCVTEIEAGEGWQVRADGVDGEIVVRSDRVLIAAGLKSQALLGTALDLGLRPVKGQVLHLVGERLIDRVVRTPKVYLVPREDRLVVGASEEEMGEHAAPLAGVTLELLYEAWRTLPGIYDLELDRIVVGHRPSTRDGRPVIGEVPERPGLFVAAGHHRHGVLLVPWTAERLAKLWGLPRAGR